MNKKPQNTAVTRAPTQKMRKNAYIVLALVCAFFVANVMKLCQLQIIEGEEWQKRAVSQQMSDTVVTAKRGPIYDANLQPLAESADVWKIIMSPKNIAACNWKAMEGVDTTKKLTDEEAVQLMRQRIATDLSEMFDLDYDKLYEQTGKVHSQYEVIQSKV